MRFNTPALVAGLTLIGTSFSAQAAWELDSSASSLHYVTSKAAAISEVNHFSGLSGHISDDGRAMLEIDLSTVDTMIEIRNQRMQEIVFEVDTYPVATVSVNVDAAALEDMAPGSTMSDTYTATVDLHGMSRDMDAALQIVKLDDGTIQVGTASPLLVSAGSFGLAEAVEELRGIAGLPSINPTIVVDFTLVYDRD